MTPQSMGCSASSCNNVSPTLTISVSVVQLQVYSVAKMNRDDRCYRESSTKNSVSTSNSLDDQSVSSKTDSRTNSTSLQDLNEVEQESVGNQSKAFSARRPFSTVLDTARLDTVREDSNEDL